MNKAIVALIVLAAVGAAIFLMTRPKDTDLQPEKPGPSKPAVLPLPAPPEKRLLTNIPSEPKAYIEWAMKSPSALLALEALDAVGRLSAPWTDAILAEALATDEDGEFEDQELAGAALLAKANRGDPDLLPALTELYKQSDEDWDVDMLIARALGRIPGEDSLNLLVAMVNREDADEDTCQVAIESLARMDGKVARDAIKSLLDHDDENVQATAAAALLRYGDADAKRLMKAFFADPEATEWDEDVVAKALGIEGSTEALPYLMQLSAHEFWDTRQLAIRALGATRLPDARKALMDSLSDDDEDVAVTTAVTLLVEFKDESGVDLLTKTAETSKDPELVTDAIRALATLGRAEHTELFRTQFAVEARSIEQLPGKLWAAWAILKSADPK